MKYIRTKDGIIEINPTLTNEQIDISLGKNTPRADTIEELCDEFVFNDKDGLFHKPYYQVQHNYKDFKKDWLFYQHNENDNWFSAIWTDKGLIYVAKMNDKGELVLL